MPRWIFVSVGALVNRLDPGIIPFRKATEFQIHVSGGEFNCAANLSDCFGNADRHRHRHGGLSHRRSDRGARAAMGVKPFYKRFKHDGVARPQHGHRIQRRGHGMARPRGVL